MRISIELSRLPGLTYLRGHVSFKVLPATTLYKSNSRHKHMFELIVAYAQQT